MSKIIPITDLRKTNEISSLCHKTNEPIFVTKNGYEDLVIMSNEFYEKSLFSEKTLQNSNIFNNFNESENTNSTSFGFLKVAASTTKISVGNVSKNVLEIKKSINSLIKEDVDIVLFQELGLTGYTANDLFLTSDLQKNVIKGLYDLLKYSENINQIFIVGAPIKHKSKLFNCAIVIKSGSILGVVPKTYLPNYSEFYEKRYFESAKILGENTIISLCNQSVPFGSDLVFKDMKNSDFSFGIEICEDLWVPETPSTNLCLNGANIIFNLSASNELIGKADSRRNLIKSASSRLVCAYVYCSCGDGESTTDLIFSGHNLICENGHLLKESKLFENESTITDIDLDLIKKQRTKNTSYSDTKSTCRKVFFDYEISYKKLTRKYKRKPFVSTDEKIRVERSDLIIKMQAKSLIQRLESIKYNNVVVGFSGGLDSTLALLACYEAFKLAKYPLNNIHVITLPSFGTSNLTYSNAIKLTKLLGTDFKEINIKRAVEDHLKDINHSLQNQNVTFENAQARERTQIILDYCNDVKGIMIGTGDLSELCLGFTTFGGDHLSNYGLNASLPKTLIQAVVKDYADSHSNVKEVLYSILNTPISPELLPPNGEEIVQKTEENIGPYELHDFFIYHFLRYNFSFEKIYYLALKTFEGSYSKDEIKRTLKIFIRRFFTNQFKRNCLPDGIKIGACSISPRGDLRLPSDIDYSEYLESIDQFEL